MDAALLDTDTVNEVLKQRHRTVVQCAAIYLTQHPQFSISAVTRYELLRGLKEKDARQQLIKFESVSTHLSWCQALQFSTVRQLCGLPLVEAATRHATPI